MLTRSHDEVPCLTFGLLDTWQPDNLVCHHACSLWPVVGRKFECRLFSSARQRYASCSSTTPFFFFAMFPYCSPAQVGCSENLAPKLLN